jgi:hypothetical protein
MIWCWLFMSLRQTMLWFYRFQFMKEWFPNEDGWENIL